MEQAPARIWLARPYAEAIAADYYASENPPSLHASLSELKLFSVPETRRSRLGIFDLSFKYSAVARELVSLLRSRKFGVADIGKLFQKRLNPSLNAFSERLQNGERLQLSNDSTEQETKLRRWILEQPEHSIAPHKLMAHALALTGGELISAWAISWNVMSANWETAATRNYDDLINRFTSQTGERYVWRGGARFIVRTDLGKSGIESTPRIELAFSKRGDEFSYMYHRIGVELFTMVSAKLSGSSLIGSLLGRMGALGEYFLFREAAGLKIERRKRLINDLLAASSGSRILEIAQGRRRDFPIEKADASKYLRDAPIIYGRRYQMADGRPAQYFNSQEEKIYWSEVMSERELVAVFTQAKENMYWPLHPLLLDSNGDLERLQLGLAKYASDGAGNEVLNHAMKEWVELEGKPRDFEYTDFSMAIVASAAMTSGLRDADSYVDIHSRLRRSVDKALAQRPIKLTCESVFRF